MGERNHTLVSGHAEALRAFGPFQGADVFGLHGLGVDRDAVGRVAFSELEGFQGEDPLEAGSTCYGLGRRPPMGLPRTELATVAANGADPQHDERI